MNLTIDFYQPEWHNHRIVCQCYDKDVLAQMSDDAYTEKHISLTELERYIADVYHYTGQYYDSDLEEYFDKEDWDSVLYDLQLILDRREQAVADMPGKVPLRLTSLPNIPVIIKELIVVRDVA